MNVKWIKKDMNVQFFRFICLVFEFMILPNAAQILLTCHITHNISTCSCALSSRYVYVCVRYSLAFCSKLYDFHTGKHDVVKQQLFKEHVIMTFVTCKRESA